MIEHDKEPYGHQRYKRITRPRANAGDALPPERHGECDAARGRRVIRLRQMQLDGAVRFAGGAIVMAGIGLVLGA